MRKVRLGSIPPVRRLAGAGGVRPEVVLYQSWSGRYADSPRAIFEELRRRGAPLRHVWTAPADGDLRGAPPGTLVVREHSPAYLRVLQRARWVVANDSMPTYYRKPPAATYVQTWHGTPLKRIAFDIPDPERPDTAAYLRRVVDDVAKWDYLVSPSPFATAALRGAFRYDGAVLETGYPRNDPLLAPDAAAVREATRAALGVAEGDRAVLYAPTFRDDGRSPLGVDPGDLAQRLGPGTSILLRLHSIDAAARHVAGHPRVRDVSDVPDARELYLAADVLVTDYSSVMFDFAVTGRPIVLFCFDLERYRDSIRGFYFDPVAEAPGPVVTTIGELEAVLGAEGAAAPDERYARFRERFCGLEDGRAAARVVDAAFAGQGM